MFVSRFIAGLVICLAVFSGLPAAHADEAPYYNYNQISFQVSVAREIAHDVMQLTLYHEAQDANPVRLAEQTTTAINKATLKARQVTGITMQTGRRYVTAIHGKEGQEIIAWRERAELHLESTDFAALSRLASDLSGEMKMAGHSFLVSKSRQQEIENALIDEAITAFRERAQIATQALGGKSYKLLNLNLDRSGFAPRLMREMVQMSMSSPEFGTPAQQIEAGSTEAVIIASGVIEVKI